VYDIDALEEAERRVLTETVAGWRERFPQVPLTQRLVRGRPGRVLVEETATAQLVVVGARGRGGFSGLLLGSVSHAVLHHAKCPLTIVRSSRQQKLRSSRQQK
jgi:nucleotide-binding universal stress UspA family protein